MTEPRYIRCRELMVEQLKTCCYCDGHGFSGNGLSIGSIGGAYNGEYYCSDDSRSAHGYVALQSLGSRKASYAELERYRRWQRRPGPNRPHDVIPGAQGVYVPRKRPALPVSHRSPPLRSRDAPARSHSPRRLQPPRDPTDARLQRLEQLAALAPTLAPARQQIHLHEVHGIHVGVA